MKKLLIGVVASAACFATTPVFAADVSFLLEITNSPSGTSVDTPRFRITNTSTFTGAANGADALSAYLTSFSLSFPGPSYVDAVFDFSNPAPRTGPALMITHASPDDVADNVGNPGFDLEFSGFNPGDTEQFKVDFDRPGGLSGNYRTILDGSTISVQFANGTSQSMTLSGFNPNVSTYLFAVPEPATWAMMITGFGFVAGSMRLRRRKQQASVAFA